MVEEAVLPADAARLRALRQRLFACASAAATLLFALLSWGAGLVFASTRNPQERGARDPNPLAVLWRWLDREDGPFPGGPFGPPDDIVMGKMCPPAAPPPNAPPANPPANVPPPPVAPNP